MGCKHGPHAMRIFMRREGLLCRCPICSLKTATFTITTNSWNQQVFPQSYCMREEQRFCPLPFRRADHCTFHPYSRFGAASLATSANPWDTAAEREGWRGNECAPMKRVEGWKEGRTDRTRNKRPNGPSDLQRQVARAMNLGLIQHWLTLENASCLPNVPMSTSPFFTDKMSTPIRLHPSDHGRASHWPDWLCRR